jgi:hyperosmotically inducible periplasmic protein
MRAHGTPVLSVMAGSILATALLVGGCDRNTNPGANSSSSSSPSAMNQTAPAPSPAPNPSTTPNSGAAPDQSASNAASNAANPAAPGMQTGDASVGAHVTAAIQADSQLQGQNIAVASNNGLVTLSGSVADPAQRDRAAQVTLAVAGVTGVANRINVN